MRRLLAPLPATYSLTQLRAAAQARFATLIDFNTVDVAGTPNAAVYLPDGNTTDPAAWQASVAAHTPTHPTPEEQATSAGSNADTIRAQAAQALATNKTDITQAGNISTQAAAIAATTGTFTLAQATTNIRSLAQGVKLLADHDIATKQQINGLIRLVIGQLDATD